MAAIGVGYVVLFLVGLLTARWLNRDGHRVNPGLAGALAMTPLLTLQIGLIATLADRLLGPDPRSQGEIAGYLLGPAAIMYGVATLLALRARRHSTGLPAR